MDGINYGVIVPVETICGPVEDFKQLTLASNAVTLGWMGYGAGLLTCILFYVGFVHVAPKVIEYGRRKGWWS